MTNVSATIEQITPALAEKLLENNTNNRDLNEAAVRRHSAAMTEGKWVFDGAPIRIATDGTLLDGQHRLNSIVRSATTQEMLVVRGVAKGAQDVMDTGKKRSLSDVLYIRQEVNTNFLAGLLVAAEKWENGARGTSIFNGSYAGRTVPQNADIIQFFNQNPDEFRAAVQVGDRVRRAVPVAPRVATLAAYLLNRVDADDASAFFARLADGVNLEADSPILVLRERLLKINASDRVGRSKVNPAYSLAMIIKAWNSYRDGDSINRIKYTPGGVKQEKYPEPR